MMKDSHFEGLSIDKHLKEKKLETLRSRESHGSEPTGAYYAFFASAKETALLALLLWTVLVETNIPAQKALFILATVAGGWVLWRGCITAYKAWCRLEKLHRVILQEKHEIANNREEEREELKEMYRAKGLEGKLLDDVIDVFMSDDDRLLKLMLEEEFGIVLEAADHPIRVGLFASLGALLSAFFLSLSYMGSALYGFPIMALALLVVPEALIASIEKKSLIHAVVWILAIGFISIGLSHFLIIWLSSFWFGT